MFLPSTWLDQKTLRQVFVVRPFKCIQGICQYVFLALSLLVVGCQQQSDGLAKANFDIRALDSQGLDGGVALDFEFCLANQDALIDEVNQLYPKLQIMASSRGRIGCDVSPKGDGAQILVIGNTAVENYRTHFINLAAHPSIVRIERTYWE
ncbi:hypothetical protein [Motilimonas sp. KMU-193]|uniref:hypothetical protein n=1 Tax=Motilimonas sp. KMU-193 TaxID=3388668 RepID=UPI00396B37AB